MIPLDSKNEIIRAERRYVEKVKTLADDFVKKKRRSKVSTDELLTEEKLNKFAESIGEQVNIGVIEAYNEGVTGIRLPNKNEIWLPMGSVEEGLSKIFNKNPSPSSKELNSFLPKGVNDIFSFHDYEKIKKDFELANNEHGDKKDWYKEAAEVGRGLVGAENLREFSTLWGITSAQTNVLENLGNTLWTMMNARKFDIRTADGEKKFRDAVLKEKPNGRRPNYTPQRLDAVVKFYKGEGYSSTGNVKTYVYSKLTEDRGIGTFNPFSVMDTHMVRMFNSKTKLDEEGRSKVMGNPMFQRTAMYVTSKLRRS